MTPPFGAFAPSFLEEAARRAATGLPDNAFGKGAASLLLRAAGGKSGRPFDVTVFGGERARLHPYDNISEKRVYITPHFWDPNERAFLARAIKAHEGPEFLFIDVGANAGLYTLFARATARAAGKSFRALCVEPDATMCGRLSFNLKASGADADVSIAAYAATATDGRVAFDVNPRNRGMNRLHQSGAACVEGRRLTRLLHEAGFARVDALKIDIEGSEVDALAPLLHETNAPRPGLLIAEVSHEGEARSLSALIEGAGYARIFANRLNAVFAQAGAIL